MGGDWRNYALCAGVNPELFFPETGAWADISKAVRICLDCPVIRQCGEFAEATHSDYGIWAARPAPERRPAGRRPRGSSGSNREGRPEHGDAAGAQRERRQGKVPCDECLAAERQRGAVRRASGARSRRKGIPGEGNRSVAT